MIDPLTRLSELQSAEPTPERAARIRRRGRAELARRAQRAAQRAAPRTAPSGRFARSPLWQAAVAILCVAYVAEAIVLAVEVLRSR